MIISVTIRNGDGETWQKEYIDERLQKLKKYLDHPVEAHVVLSVEKFRNVAEINLVGNGLNLNAKEEDKDMHLAIDNAVVKIERQIKKHKEKLRSHKNHFSRDNEIGMGEDLDDAEELGGGRVVAVKNLPLKPMSLDDAVMEMETSKTGFVVYRDAKTENIHVIYRQEDGNFALIETTG